MADEQFYFPKLVYKSSDPTTADNLSKGYTINTRWYNTVSDRCFSIIDSESGKWYLELKTDPLKVNITSTSDIELGDDTYIGFGGNHKTDSTVKKISILQSKIKLTRDATNVSYNEFCARVEQSIVVNTNETYHNFENPSVFQHFSYGSITMKDAYVGDSIYLLGDCREAYLNEDFFEKRGITFFRNKEFTKRASLIWDEPTTRFKLNLVDDLHPENNKITGLVTDQDFSAGANQLVAKDDSNDDWRLVFVPFDKQFKVYTPGGNAFGLSTIVYSTRNPVSSDYDEYYVGQTWINTVSNQVFTLVDKNAQTRYTTWASDSFTNNESLPNLSDDCEFQIYLPEKDTYYKTSLKTIIEYIQGNTAPINPNIPTNSNFQTDQLDNLMPYTEFVNGLFELDGNGDFMPTETIKSDQYFELVDNDENICPKPSNQTEVVISSYNFYTLIQNKNISVAQGLPIYYRSVGFPTKILTSYNLYVIPILHHGIDPNVNENKCGLGIINRDTFEYSFIPFGFNVTGSNYYISNGLIYNGCAFFIVTKITGLNTELNLIQFNCLTKQLVIVSHYSISGQKIIVDDICLKGTNIHFVGSTSLTVNGMDGVDLNANTVHHLNGIVNIDTGLFTSDIINLLVSIKSKIIKSEVIGDRIYTLLSNYMGMDSSPNGLGQVWEPYIISWEVDDFTGSTLKVLTFKQGLNMATCSIRDITDFCYDGEFIYLCGYVSYPTQKSCIIQIDPIELTVNYVKIINISDFNYPTCIKYNNNNFYMVINKGIFNGSESPYHYDTIYGNLVKINKTFTTNAIIKLQNTLSIAGNPTPSVLIKNFDIDVNGSFALDICIQTATYNVINSWDNKINWDYNMNNESCRWLCNMGSDLFTTEYAYNPNRGISIVTSPPLTFTMQELAVDDPIVDSKISNTLPSGITVNPTPVYVNIDSANTVTGGNIAAGSPTLTSVVISPATTYSKFEFL